MLRPDVAQQGLARGFLARMAARVDVADAAAGRQTDVPGPARFLRGGDGLRGHRSIGRVERHLHGERRIAKEDVAAILEADAEGLADEQRREAAAIDEQVAGDLAGLPRQHALDIARLTLFDLHDVREHMADAELFGTMFREERRELAGIQMIRIVGEGPVLRAGDRLRGQSLIAQSPLGGHEIAEAGLRAARSQCGTRFTWEKPCGSISG